MRWYHKDYIREKTAAGFYRIRKRGGETLLELMISIGLFAITMLMLATMFAAANKTTKNNLDAEVLMDQSITSIVKEESVANKDSFTVTFQITGGGTCSKEVERIKSEGLYKYRKKP